MGIIEINTSAIAYDSLQTYEETCVKGKKELHFGFSFLQKTGVQMWLHMLISPGEL